MEGGRWREGGGDEEDLGDLLLLQWRVLSCELCKADAPCPATTDGFCALPHGQATIIPMMQCAESIWHDILHNVTNSTSSPPHFETLRC